MNSYIFGLKIEQINARNKIIDNSMFRTLPSTLKNCRYGDVGESRVVVEKSVIHVYRCVQCTVTSEQDDNITDKLLTMLHTTISPYKMKARGYLMVKASMLEMIWMTSSTMVTVCSGSGPVSLKMKLISVRLLHSIIFTVLSSSILMSTSLTLASLVMDNIERHTRPILPSFSFSKHVMEYETLSSSLLYLGNLCLGHGMK